MLIPTAACSVLLYLTSIVFGRFILLFFTRLINKFIPEKVRNLFKPAFKWLCKKLRVMCRTLCPTTPKPPKTCSAPNCRDSSEPTTATTSFMELDLKPHAPEDICPAVRKYVVGKGVVKHYELPAFLKTSETEGVAVET